MSPVCRETEDLVDELVDGTLDEARERAIRAHLRACADCARLVADTERLVAAAGALDKLDPPAELWGRIASQLDADDRQAESRPRLWWRWQAWRGPWLAFAGGGVLAGAAALVLVFGGIGRQPLALAPPVLETPRQARFADAQSRLEQAEASYAQALAELGEVVAGERPAWPTETARVFDENLAAIDAAIERTRAEARRRPGDVAAEESLALAYQRKMEFMQEAALRGGL